MFYSFLFIHAGLKCKIAKLFAKHFKVQEQIELLSKQYFPVAVGTPNRLSKLVELGALSLSRVKVKTGLFLFLSLERFVLLIITFFVSILRKGIGVIVSFILLTFFYLHLTFCPLHFIIRISSFFLFSVGHFNRHG